MAITAADIHNQSFSIDRKGYDVDEVDVFLEQVAEGIDELYAQIASLEDELQDARDGGGSSRDGESSRSADAAEIVRLERALAEKELILTDLERQIEERNADNNAISQALIIAQRSADELLSQANAEAADTVQEARDEASRILERANAEKQEVIESIRRLEDDREEAREDFQAMLKDFISDASRKLVDLGGTVGTNSYTPSQPSVRFSDDRIVAASEDRIEEVAVDYVTPATTSAPAAPPVASGIEKDLSGYGDTEDADFEEID